MALNMTRPTRRSDAATFQFKKRTPRALLTARKGERIVLRLPDPDGGGTKILTTVGDVIKVSLRTREPSLAKLRCAAISFQLERLASTATAGPQRLTQREVRALGGEWHRKAMNRWEDDPGPASVWEHLRDGFCSLRDDDWASLQEHAGSLVDESLAEEGLGVDEDTRQRLLLAFRDTLRDSAAVLAKRAEGDYGDDPLAAKLPKWTGAETARAPLTITELLAGWTAEAKRLDKSASTIDGFSRVICQFVAFLGHDDATRVTRQDVLRYKEKRLIKDRRSPKTVRDADLVALKSVFGWGAENRPGRTQSNPAAGITLKLPKKLKRKGHSKDAASQVLRAALAYKRKPREGAKTAAAKRLVPWVLAFTGARVGEIAQLRREDVIERNGIWAIRITPDAGPVKDKEEREIPLHPQLIEIGLIEYAKSISSGYLFVTATDRSDLKGSLQSLLNRLGEFVRSIVREDRVAALHGWRRRAA
jgi:integrase